MIPPTGPVCATIELRDETTAVCSAWVITAPPDFAPGIKNLITLYDAIYDVAVRRGVLTAPTDPPHRPSFAQHIQPILTRALGYRWVNRFGIDGFLEEGIGTISTHDDGEPCRFWEKLADPSSGSSILRTSLMSRLRNPDPCPEKRAEPPCPATTPTQRPVAVEQGRTMSCP